MTHVLASLDAGLLAVRPIIKLVVAAILVPTTALILGIVFLFKVMSWMQSRKGPQEAGPRGLLQLLADGAKFVQKEDLIPDGADRCRVQGGAARRADVDAAALRRRSRPASTW